MKEITVEAMEGLIRASDSSVTPGSEEYQAALVVLAAMHRGHGDRAELAAFTGVPFSKVSAFAERLEAGGVWQDGGATDCTCYEDGDLCFWLDVMVAVGESLRTLGEDGRPSYQSAGH